MNITYNNKDILILIVDDISENLQLLGAVLSNEKYKVAAISDSTKVLDQACKYNPDLILLDIMMPSKNGYEVCEELKAHPDTREIPVIFLSAKTEQEDINKGLMLGGADYVTKPFNTRELLERVKTHVRLKKSKDLITRQNEELRKLTDAKNRIYQVVGHDLRSPLNGLQGLLQMLVMDVEDGEFDREMLLKQLSYLSESSSKINLLLNDLLDWTRIQTGDIQVQSEEVNIRDVAEEAIQLMSFSAGKKGVTIHINAEEDLRAETDRRMIGTIIRNFISNAIKYSEPGGEIIFDASNKGDELEIKLTDNGIGMDEETLANLKKGLHFASMEGTAREKGTGVGLILSKQLTSLLGGALNVDSSLGKGSEFTLNLPLKEPARNSLPNQ